jgi:transcriptional regulator GlxA family with amidase domain
MTRSVLIVVFEGVQRLDVTGPMEVFAGAGAATTQPYRITIAGPGGRPLRTSSGLRLLPTRTSTTPDRPTRSWFPAVRVPPIPTRRS